MPSVRSANEDDDVNQRFHDAVTSDLWRAVQPFLLAVMTVFMGVGAKAMWSTYSVISEMRESQARGEEIRKSIAKAQDSVIASLKVQAASQEQLRHDVDKNTYDINVLKEWWRDDTKRTRPAK